MPIPVSQNLADAIENGASNPIVLARATPFARPPVRMPRTPQGFPALDPMQQGLPRAGRNTVDTSAFDQLERNSDVEAEPNGNALDATSIRIDRKRKRNRNCCRPFDFLNEWLTKGNNIRNKFDPGINFTKSDFDLVGKDRVFTQRGFAYQYFITHDYDEYKASGGGTSQWADGQEAARCWLIEAKYHASFRSWLRQQGLDPDQVEREMANPLGQLNRGLTPPKPPGPEMRAAPTPPKPPGTDEQFQRYGKVINAPDPPAQECWNIGLHVMVSQKGMVLFEYMYRMLRYNIPGLIEYRPSPNSD